MVPRVMLQISASSSCLTSFYSLVEVMGKFANVSGMLEAGPAEEALFAAHPAMATWPSDHSWFIGKLNILNLWLINIYGGADNITPDEYYGNP